MSLFYLARILNTLFHGLGVYSLLHSGNWNLGNFDQRKFQQNLYRSFGICLIYKFYDWFAMNELPTHDMICIKKKLYFPCRLEKRKWIFNNFQIDEMDLKLKLIYRDHPFVESLWALHYWKSSVVGQRDTLPRLIYHILL